MDFFKTAVKLRNSYFIINQFFVKLQKIRANTDFLR